MQFDELRRAIRLKMGESLKDAGFLYNRPGSWSRLKDNDINVIHLQKHSFNNSFCVNLGVHYLFLIEIENSPRLNAPKLSIIDCELRFRLTDRDSEKDQWWPITGPSIDSVADIFYRRGLCIFDKYKLSGSISTLDAKIIENEESHILSSIPKIRAFLLLAYMHEYLGNREKCIEAASIGISCAGMAVGPKKTLTNILRRIRERS